MSSASDLNNSIFQCQYESCNKKFSRKGNMKIHMCNHSGFKKFTCNYENCNKSYVNLCRLNVHIRTHVYLFISEFRQEIGLIHAAFVTENSMKKEI